MPHKTQGVEISLSADTVAAVMREFERDNPGKSFDSMTSAEFANRMMAKLLTIARLLPDEESPDAR